MISFSISANESFAQFGEYNASYVVGNESGLFSLKTYNYLPDYVGANKNWALEGQSLLYDKKPLKNGGGDKSFPAIIDTGSSTLGVPAKMYAELKQNWLKETGKQNPAKNNVSVDHP